MKNVLTFFLFGFVLVSCKKDPIQYTFEGHVTDNVNHAALGGVDVSVYQIPFDGAVATSNFELAGSGQTNSSGDYEIAFDREKATEFKIQYLKDGYFTDELLLSSDEVTTDGSNTFNHTMDAKSWIKFNITNTGLSDPSDQLKLIFYSFREGCSSCATDYFNYFNGVVDTTVKYVSTAGAYFKFTYDNQNGTITTTDSLYLTPFDTVTYNISY